MALVIPFSLSASASASARPFSPLRARRLPIICCCSKGEYGGLFGVSLSSNAFAVCNTGIKSLLHRGGENVNIGIATYQEDRRVTVISTTSGEFKPPEGSVAIGMLCHQTTEVTKPVLSQDATVAVACVGKPANNKVVKDLWPSEVILQLFLELSSSIPLEKRILSLSESIDGPFCFVMIAEGWLIAARDSSGLFPLVMGKSVGGVMFATEEASFIDNKGAYDRKLVPGEILLARNGVVKSLQMESRFPERRCGMEELYFGGKRTTNLAGWIADSAMISSAFSGGRTVDVVLSASTASSMVAFAYSMMTGTSNRGTVFKSDPLPVDEDGKTKSIENSMESEASHPFGIFRGQKILLFDGERVLCKWSKKILECLKSFTLASEVHVAIINPKIQFECPHGVSPKAMGYTVDIEERLKEEGYDSCTRISATAVENLITKKNLDKLFKGDVAPLHYCIECMVGKFPLPPEERPQRSA